MTTLKPRCDLFTTLTTCLLSSDRSKDDTLKITSSSFTKDVTKTRCDLFWGQQRIFCVVILYRSCCTICVVIGTTDDTVIYAFTSPKRWHLWKYVVHGRWQLKKHVVTGQEMTPLKVRCHLCTDNNVVFKLLSSPMTTLKPRCDLFADHNVSITYASDVDTRRYNVVSTLNPYLFQGA